MIGSLLLLNLICHVHATASNSLSDCIKLAKNFKTTCSSGPVSNIIATTGTDVTCPSLTGMSCPGSTTSGSCVFQHKMCVTCFKSGSVVKIRVQSNGLPLYCPHVSSLFSETNLDFVVNFNPDVSINSPNIKITTQRDINSVVCNVSGEMRVPKASNYVSYSSPMVINVLAGVSVDGVAILNVNNRDSQDPFYPAKGPTEHVDQCLVHCQEGGLLHYHMGSGCAKYATSSTKVLPCASVPLCKSSIATYSINSFSNYKTLTVIGIAKDGHIIYGPYLSSGRQVKSGFDVCNGMFYDSIGNYAYFVTQTYPYITGCFGPSNYPSVRPSCTKNPPSAYTKQKNT
ncbi:unnamed protein product [Didymodactylos carnosus]|uniref:YHYH domain-containing protein n=1 Tax=Didymodactylos carnosus TaxID=1234261 RepID=A0A814JXL1_9BILA|nr:unnamed protein product [Didymodactylos carnosus]CAF1045033.1 unnamed protein product [Didymodactylos carnosus]CAF3620141.1 unnamed protein product [Didymodactylos carnosus]CAF3814961.1 unnamed protein product [Didymodactylos carnosus]